MVKIGDFSVQLVHAETGEPFPEVSSPIDGKTYAEVEPNAEYKIRVKTEYYNPVRCDFWVDGNKLNYYKKLEKSKFFDMVLFETRGGMMIETAFKFAKASVLDRPTGAQAPKQWTGYVEVQFSEAIIMGKLKYAEHSIQNWKHQNVGSVVGAKKQKGVTSQRGDVHKTYKENPVFIHHEKGMTFNSIKLYYCSTIGLIENGILPKPPNYEFQKVRRAKPYLKSPVGKRFRVEPKEVTLTSNDANISSKKYEIFDLTCIGNDEVPYVHTQTVVTP